MCGIVGKVLFDRHQSVRPESLDRMMDTIAHRGPDGAGKYIDGPAALGHRRLSIIDLGGGSQPMCNEDQTVWITFNGEIYNYAELRRRLMSLGHVLKTDSDTEVIVHLWEQYGVGCLEHLRGMFAFGLWDANQRALFLARDRVGIKPLYYCETPRALIFASEIKALLVDPDVSRQVSPEAVDRFLTYLYLPGSGTMFEHIHKLEPGHYLLAKNGVVVRERYWDLQYAAVGQQWRNLGDAADELGVLLREAVKGHMISDVPVGFLDRGGVDSTALLSYAVDETETNIQTFTVGFSDSAVVDERRYARLASERFNTLHHEITISADDFRAFLPKYVWHMEEPVCEPPAIALYYVSKLARQHVKVLLSGEGGDEAFGGYPEYRNYPVFERWKERTSQLRSSARTVIDWASRVSRSPRIGKYATLIDLPLPDYYYSRLTTPHDYFNRKKPWLYADAFANAARTFDPTQITRGLFSRVATNPTLNQLLYVDTKTWLPDDLLIKADKMTMATSLELRVPFLDHKVLEFAATLPPEFKVRGRELKRVLKKAFEKRVPDPILKRKKAGFPVPYNRWLLGDLKDFVHGTLLSSRAVSRGYFRKEAIEVTLSGGPQPIASARDIFSLLVLELWHQQFVDCDTGSDRSWLAAAS